MITTPNRGSIPRRKMAQADALQPSLPITPAPAHSARFVPSPEQHAYFKWIENDRGSLILESVAGSGKSTTALQGLPYMNGSVFLGAFNKPIAEELREKADHLGFLRKGVFISTMHAAGFNAVRRAYPNVKVEAKKTALIIDRLVADDPATAPPSSYFSFITKMVSFGKQFLIGVRSPVGDLTKWYDLVDHFGTDSDLPEVEGVDIVLEALRHVILIYELSKNECVERIDFDDMIYMPIAYNLRLFRNDWVIIDEAQDTNLARQELARRMLQPGGRLVAIGDSCQAIYAFTGADSDSLNRIAREHNCKRLSLSVSYRCPRAVVKHVQQWVSHIQAHPSAPEGIVRPVKYDSRMLGRDKKPLPWFMQDEPGNEDAILCRYNAPLVRTAFSMLREGMACRIEGRDLGLGLIKLAERWKVKTLEALRTKLELYRKREIDKAQKVKSEQREQTINDQVDTLLIFIDRCTARGENHLACLIEEINRLFGDNVHGVVTLCSIHKSKGREWNTVYDLEQEIKGLSRMKDWEKTAERNLAYVKGTRSKNELVLVGKESQALPEEKKS